MRSLEPKRKAEDVETGEDDMETEVQLTEELQGLKGLVGGQDAGGWRRGPRHNAHTCGQVGLSTSDRVSSQASTSSTSHSDEMVHKLKRNETWNHGFV